MHFRKGVFVCRRKLGNRCLCYGNSMRRYGKCSEVFLIASGKWSLCRLQVLMPVQISSGSTLFPQSPIFQTLKQILRSDNHNLGKCKKQLSFTNHEKV